MQSVSYLTSLIHANLLIYIYFNILYFNFYIISNLYSLLAHKQLQTFSLKTLTLFLLVINDQQSAVSQLTNSDSESQFSNQLKFCFWIFKLCLFLILILQFLFSDSYSLLAHEQVETLLLLTLTLSLSINNFKLYSFSFLLLNN